MGWIVLGLIWFVAIACAVFPVAVIADFGGWFILSLFTVMCAGSLIYDARQGRKSGA